MSLNEADTCRVFVTPKLRAAGWEEPPHLIAEQQTFTDGRVRIVAGKTVRGERKRVDYWIMVYEQDDDGRQSRGIQCTEHGPDEFQITHALKLPTIAARGNAMEIADLFGGPLAMRQSVQQLQAVLYAEAGAGAS